MTVRACSMKVHARVRRAPLHRWCARRASGAWTRAYDTCAVLVSMYVRAARPCRSTLSACLRQAVCVVAASDGRALAPPVVSTHPHPLISTVCSVTFGRVL